MINSLHPNISLVAILTFFVLLEMFSILPL